MHIISYHTMSKMSGTQKSSVHFQYVMTCPDCDFESSSKSEKQQKLKIRLHAKTCKKTGRTGNSTLEADQQSALTKSGGGCVIDDAYNQRNNGIIYPTQVDRTPVHKD